MTEQTDRKYYQVIRKGAVAERLLVLARDRIYADLVRTFDPSPASTILDVGVSDVVNDAANYLERLYPFPDRITACGLGRAPDFRESFPLVEYVQIEPDLPLPFRDQQFDLATSNAVLEHVGSVLNQLRFLNELCRVGKRVFVSVPNRFFPVEHHTAIPFLHWTDGSFRVACVALGKGEWRQERNLILMTRRRLAELLPRSRQWMIGYTGLPLGPLSSNLFAASQGRAR
jgi:SAM-dependent methyltransferase